MKKHTYPPLGGVTAGSRERKRGLAVKEKGGQSCSQSSSSFLSHLEMRSSNQRFQSEKKTAAAAAQPPKDGFDKHLFFGPIIFFSPSSFWPKRHPSISLLCHQIETCQARGKGWRMKKKKSEKNPRRSKGTKRNMQLFDESFAGGKKGGIFLAQLAIFCVLARHRHAEEASTRDVVLPRHALFAKPVCMQSPTKLCLVEASTGPGGWICAGRCVGESKSEQFYFEKWSDSLHFIHLRFNYYPRLGRVALTLD